MSKKGERFFGKNHKKNKNAVILIKRKLIEEAFKWQRLMLRNVK